ncbi:hypothetical protein [Micromonospora sp. WMMD1219]|uniref:hypothetical protein n=1 Tax=Micromonospora sp. WMMD1219 TaxID=3404115 RepID=UPI003BF47FC6
MTFIDSTVISVRVIAHHAARRQVGTDQLHWSGPPRSENTGLLPLLSPDDTTCAPPPSDV